MDTISTKVFVGALMHKATDEVRWLCSMLVLPITSIAHVVLSRICYTGAPGSMVDNLDYHNAFVGHYDAGDIQHNGHHSYSNLNLIYWKATKNFGNGCSSHLVGGSYADGNLAL